MDGKRFSELPDAGALTGNDILAVSQLINGVLESRKVTVQQLISLFSRPVKHVLSGESLITTEADPGVYIFDSGSSMSKAPLVDSIMDDVRSARLEVVEKGTVMRLWLWGSFRQVAGQFHAGQFEFFKSDITNRADTWSFIGPGESKNPQVSDRPLLIMNDGTRISRETVNNKEER